MYDISKEISYIKGLADGLSMREEDSNESKIILKMLAAMDKMADRINELENNLADADDEICYVEEKVDDIHEALTKAVDMAMAHGDLDDYDDFDDFDDDDDYDEYDDDDEDFDDLYEMECPNCHEDVMIEFDMINDDNAIICPNCHEEIPLEFNFDDDFEEE